MSQKMYYTTIGYLLTFVNILLIETKFNIVGLFFGVSAIFYFLKALSIRPK